MCRRPVGVLLGAIVAGAVVVRLVHFASITRTAFPDLPTVYTESDMYATWRWAQTILAGDVLGRDTYHPYTVWMQAMAPLETWYRWWGGKEIFQQAPGYAYFVAVVLGLSGGSLRALLLVQLLLGALEPLVIFAVARRLFDARAGLVAAALVALHGPLLFYQGAELRDWLPPLLEPLVLLLLLRADTSGRGRDWLAAGAAMGLVLLVKETILLFLPFVLAWIWWTRRPVPRAALVASGAIVGGLLLALSPLLLRNALVGAPLFAVSNRAIEGLVLGHAADSSAVGAIRPSSLGSIYEQSGAHLLRAAMATLGTYHGDWWMFLGFQWTKVRGLLDPFEAPNNLSFAYGLEISPVLRWLPAHGVMAPLGVAGFLGVLGAWRRHALLLLYAASTVGALLFSVIIDRYRLMLVPVLAVYAGAGVVRAVEALVSRRPAVAGTWAVAVAGLALIQQLAAPLPSLRDNPTFMLHYASYLYSAQVYAGAADFERAVGEMERLRARALALRSRGEPFARAAADAAVAEGDVRAQWAQHLLGQGRREEARRQVELVEASYAVRPRLSGAQYNLALLYRRLDEPGRARAALQRFLVLEPAGPRAERARRMLDDLADDRARGPSR